MCALTELQGKKAAGRRWKQGQLPTECTNLVPGRRDDAKAKGPIALRDAGEDRGRKMS